MNPKFSPRLLSAIASLSFALVLGGCASREEREARRKWETHEDRTTREVFRSNWLVPSVSEEDKNFFYRSFTRNSDF
ncbi:MAG: hypothetical protein ABI318_05945 [Chthoniobacteraceae bacterium]